MITRIVSPTTLLLEGASVLCSGSSVGTCNHIIKDMCVRRTCRTHILFTLTHILCDVRTPLDHVAWKKHSFTSPNRSLIYVYGVDPGSKCQVRQSCVSNPLILCLSHSLIIHEFLKRASRVIPLRRGEHERRQPILQRFCPRYR